MDEHPLGKIIRKLEKKLLEAHKIAEGHLPTIFHMIIFSKPSQVLDDLISRDLDKIYMDFDNQLSGLNPINSDNAALLAGQLVSLNRATLNLLRFIDVDAKDIQPRTKANCKIFGDKLMHRCGLGIDQLNTHTQTTTADQPSVNFPKIA